MPTSRRQRLLQALRIPLRRVALCLLVVCFSASARADEGEGGKWIDHAHTPEVARIEENPLKGMFPYESSEPRSFPHSMEWFYVPLNELQKGETAFNWDPFERHLKAIAERGNHSVFRVYLDYPGKPVGTPQFLIDAGLKMHGYSESGNGNGASRSPDWNDPRLLEALENFIRNLGKKYDGDPRIGFVTAGLYGFWGEWHNYPHDPEWAMTPENRDRLLKAYCQAFTKTQVLLRDPMGTTDPILKTSFGYHDDSFSYETLRPGWAFLPRLQGNGLSEIWKSRAIGGEIRPELQATIFDAWPNSPTALEGKASEDLAGCIKSTHASWMLNEGLFTDSLKDTQRSNALRAQRLFGYQLHVSGSRVYRGDDGKLRVEVRIKNSGVAPFYYRWPAEFAAYDAETGDTRMLGQATNWNLPDILPDDREYRREFLAPEADKAGGQRLLLRLVNPLENGKPLRFTNARQDRDREGWLTLQDIPDENGSGKATAPNPR